METDKKALVFNSAVILMSLFILFTGPLFVVQNLSFVLVQVMGALLIIWALIVNKVNKPHEKHKLPKGYFFLTHGPYEIVRHPIYAGFLLIMMSFLQYDFVLLRVLAFVVLFVFIFLKMVREEHTMEQEIKEYAEYKAKTQYLIPFLF